MSVKGEEGNPGASMTRRDFFKGVVAGAVVAAIAAIGIEELRIADMEEETTTSTTTLPGTTVTKTSTVATTALTTTTVPGPTSTKTTATTTTVTTGAPLEVGYSRIITLRVNGEDHTLEVMNNWTLLEVLNNKLGLVGTKDGCDRGSCGACTIIMDGRAVYSCTVLAVEAEGKDIVTIEGLSNGINLDPVQQAFKEHEAMQCGYCTPGFIMAGRALLDANPNPTEEEVKLAISGNLCRCGSYQRIVEAILMAAGG